MKTIKSKTEFEKVFVQGKRANRPTIKVRVLRSQGDPGRVAFVAPKRLGNAVFRNRCKRVLREAARICELPREGMSTILFATPQTKDTKPADVALDLRKALVRLGIDDG